MNKKQYKQIFLPVVLLSVLMLFPQPSYAQWPPFSFRLIPSFENNRITYHIRLSNRVDWQMTDVTIKVKLPEGVRFVSAQSIPGIEADFDGAEVTFFIPVLSKRIREGDAFFVVDVTEPAKTIFTTYAWIDWQGKLPGSYVTDDFSIDITRQPLIWDVPASSRLQLEAGATITNNIITYALYPRNVGERMQDLEINVPLPSGATFLSASAPASFTTDFDGQEISFSTIELASNVNIDPLTLMVSVEAITDTYIVTHAWATWKNVGRRVGISIAPQEDVRTGDIVVQPHSSQGVVSDVIGDVPFSNYDITSIALQSQGPNLYIKFYISGSVDSANVPLEYYFYIDKDCSADTGQSRGSYGIDYRARYRHQRAQADLGLWDEKWIGKTPIESTVDRNIITMWLPIELLDIPNNQFCWIAETRYRTTAFSPNPPRDIVPDSNMPDVTRYEMVIGGNETNSNPQSFAPLIIEDYLIKPGESWHYLKGYGEVSYPVEAWKQINYDDSGWLTGPSSIGYGNNDETTILGDMRGRYNSVFLRHTFDVYDPAQTKSLIMEIDYDDGFVAYLNGVEIARRNIGDQLLVPYNARAIISREAGVPERIDLTEYVELLVPGKNVLAIQGHNDHKYGADFFIAPILQQQYIVQAPTLS